MSLSEATALQIVTDRNGRVLEAMTNCFEREVGDQVNICGLLQQGGKIRGCAITQDCLFNFLLFVYRCLDLNRKTEEKVLLYMKTVIYLLFVAAGIIHNDEFQHSTLIL